MIVERDQRYGLSHVVRMDSEEAQDVVIAIEGFLRDHGRSFEPFQVERLAVILDRFKEIAL